ncbi:ubiquitin-conjugating enzyme [Hamiltosporidium magnivora]|uniref:Ubiquitin-conjugating enzyme E2 H n=1 Tax=Hamiltosporidium magnivora TaxID=148818 RepID=A0A4Q9KZX5_9MICR|nr:ubiquitin-conjugating enzyme [Hamiltosporidium magnivora]
MRIRNEICKLCNKNYGVVLKNDNFNDIEVTIEGPPETPFYGGKFVVNIHIPDDYPFKSPSIGFVTKVFHPNVDENSGSICLDVLNQVWSPLYDLLNVVEIFLPQLLSYPNALDPLNSEAANMYINDKPKYEKVVKEYVDKYAIPNIKEEKTYNADNSSSSVDSDSIEI